MKKYALAFAFFILVVLAFAQQTINIDEAIRPFSKGNYPSYELEIPQTHLSDITKEWLKYLKNGSKSKPVEANGEIWIIGAVNANVSPAPFNVYSKLLETTTGVELTAWLTDNDSVYISRDQNNRDLAVQKYLNDFAAAQYRAAVKIELNGENEKLKKLQDELNTFIKQQDKSTKIIDEDRRSIGRNNDLLQTNLNDQQSKQNQIAQQQQTVDGLESSPGATLDAAKKQLKQYQNDLKKLINVNEKLHKEIDKWDADIRTEQRNITDSQNNQQLKNAEIDKQKMVVQNVQAKMDNIR
jgi:hypothetical protein